MTDELSKRYVFVIGAPRSGTTIISRLLSEHKGIASMPNNRELTFFTRYLRPIFEAWEKEKQHIENGDWEQGLPALWSEDQFQEFVDMFTSQVYGSVLKNNPGADYILDKHPGYSHTTELIRRVIPQAKFIHIIRDPRDVILSMKSANQRIGFGTDETRACARKWKKAVYAARSAAQHENQYFEIKYENLINKPEQELKRMFQFLDLSLSSSELLALQNILINEKMSSPTPESRITDTTKRWSAKYSSKDRYLINQELGKSLFELGFESNPKWWTSHTTSYYFQILSNYLFDRLVLFFRAIKLKIFDTRH